MSSMADQVVILGWETQTPSETSAQAIAEFSGANTTFVPTHTIGSVRSLRSLIPANAAVIAHVDVLVRLADRMDEGARGLELLLGPETHIFVYGFQPSRRYDALLSALSFGQLTGVAQLPDAASFHVAESSSEWTAQFAGLSIRGANPARDVVFQKDTNYDRGTALISVADEPFLVRISRGGSAIFLAGCSEMGDLDEKVPSKAGLLPWFSRVIPLLVFLRGAMGTRLWHNDAPVACFIIDDPLLKRRYGFLEYSRLIGTMGQLGAAVSMAFIPWNFRRSRKQTVELLASHQDVISLCVHGCDHTGAEFDVSDRGSLAGKAQLALYRMEAHRELSGLPFDDVMVFPQGLFSAEAIQALHECGYLAAVNTDLCPAGSSGLLRLRDLMDVAVMNYGDFPVFGRHYPNDVAEFAFDLFLGKPALVVEHHGYFRDGYDRMAAFVKDLNRVDKRLQWRNLGAICSEICMKKVSPGGGIEVRFFGNRLRVRNVASCRETYLLFRQWNPEVALPSVTLNGNAWAPERTGNGFTISLTLDPGQTAQIGIRPEETLSSDQRVKVAAKHNLKVLARRVLCEFRDDHIDTSPVLSGLVSRVRGIFRAQQSRAA